MSNHPIGYGWSILILILFCVLGILIGTLIMVLYGAVNPIEDEQIVTIADKFVVHGFGGGYVFEDSDEIRYYMSGNSTIDRYKVLQVGKQYQIQYRQYKVIMYPTDEFHSVSETLLDI